MNLSDVDRTKCFMDVFHTVFNTLHYLEQKLEKLKHVYYNIFSLPKYMRMLIN